MNCSGTARMNAKALWTFFQPQLPPEDDFSGEDELAGWAAGASPLRALFGDFLAFGVRREVQRGIGRCRRLFSTPSRVPITQPVGGGRPHAAAAGHAGVRSVGPARRESEGEEEEEDDEGRPLAAVGVRASAARGGRG